MNVKVLPVPAMSPRSSVYFKGNVKTVPSPVEILLSRKCGNILIKSPLGASISLSM